MPQNATSEPAAALLFVFLPGSPWSLRAAWALDQAGVRLTARERRAYDTRSDAPWLRAKLGVGPDARVSVPVLFVGSRALQGGMEIARWAAEERGGGGASSSSSTLALGDADALSKADAGADLALPAGRFRTFGLIASTKAYDDSILPPPVRWVPGAIKGALFASAFTQARNKYAKPEWTRDPALARDEARRGLAMIRELIQSGALPTPAPGGSVTYAHIVAATALGFVAPLPGIKRKPLGWAAKRWTDAWSDPELANEFADVLAWRDAVVVASGVVDKLRL